MARCWEGKLGFSQESRDEIPKLNQRGSLSEADVIETEIHQSSEPELFLPKSDFIK